MTLRLTTWERIQVLWTGQQDVRVEQVEQVIGSVSRQIERYLDLDGLEYKRRIEILDASSGQTVFLLRTLSVDSPLISLKNDTSREFGAGISEIDESLYQVDSRGGRLLLDYAVAPGHGVLRVEYDGGIADDAQEVVQEDGEWLDLALACEMQVLSVVTRAPHFGSSSLSLGGGNRSFETPVKLLPAVVEMLEPFRRAW